MRRTLARVAALLLCATVAGAQPPRVHVIATGGTISNMGSDPRRTGAELVAGVPGLDQVATVTSEQFSNVASGSVTLEMLRTLSRRIRSLSAEQNPPAGFIVTHGTDTMEETAFFLDLTVSGCAPVILTGAMRQANWVGADGPANLQNAVRVAASSAARNRGTLLLMNDEIFSAREVTKSNTTRLNAFTAPNAGPVGVADPDGLFFKSPPPEGACRTAPFDVDRLDTAAFPRVDIVYSYIDADSTVIDALVAAGARGIVVAGVGRGGTTPAQSRALRRATAAGVMVLTSNRTGSGGVGVAGDPSRFAQLAPGAGAMLSAGDLNPQKARLLLLLGLAAHLDASALSALFSSSR